MADIRETIDRITVEVYGKGNADLVDELFTEDFVDHTAPQGIPADREGVKMFLQMLDGAVSDAQSSVEHVLVEGDKAAWRWRMTGTHTGEFMGVPASNNTIDIAGNDIGVFRDGKLAEIWSEVDMLDAMTQMGAMSPPGS